MDYRNIDYNPKILNNQALKKMDAVLDDLNEKFTMHQNFPDMHLGHPTALESVSRDEYIFILKVLFQHGCLNCDHYDDKTGYQISLGAYYNEFTQMINEEVKRRRLLSDKPTFDEQNSIISLRGYKIKIARQNKQTLAHEILKYIFDNGIANSAFYSEIENEEYDKTIKIGKKYHAACLDIQNKITTQTNGKIKDFLIFNSSDRGEVKINKDYL